MASLIRRSDSPSRALVASSRIDDSGLPQKSARECKALTLAA